jgi:hypothetical protein
MNQVNTVNNENDKHHVIITEKVYRYVTSQGHYNESFDQILQRLLTKEGTTLEEILKLAGEEY